MADLILKYPGGATKTFPLERPLITIGRAARNDLCIPDPFASRVHAEVRREGDQYFLKDLGSANNTFCNGSIINEPVLIMPGDRIQVGETLIIYVDKDYDVNRLSEIVTDVASRPIIEEALLLNRLDHTTCGVLEEAFASQEIRETVSDQHSDWFDQASAGNIRTTTINTKEPVAEMHQDSLSTPNLTSAKSIFKYDTLIPLKPIFRFIHEPIGFKTHTNFVGRKDELNSLAERILFSEGGSFLVTGYRGVGKTSFINEAINVLRENLKWACTYLGETEILDIHLNIARPLQPAELMHHIIRGLYQRLMDEGLFFLLDPSLRDELTLAFYRTSVNMTRKLAQTSESNFGLNEASIGAAYLKATLKTSLSYKKSNTQNIEISFLGYDDKAAEQDIIRISRKLSAGYKKKQSFYQKVLNLINRITPEKTALKLIFVFDELDKLESFVASNDGTPVIDEILSCLKNLFTTSGISFVFVAGKDLQERWLDDLGRGDSIYESIFSFDKYLPCMWAEVNQICDNLVNWEKLPQSKNQSHIATSSCISCESPVNSKQFYCIECGAYVFSDYARSVLEDFKKYLAYKGRGIPRRIIKGFNEHVHWEDGSPTLGFTRQDIRRIRFYASLQNVLKDREHSLFGSIHEEIHGTQQDKRRLGVFYFIDWVLRQSNNRFTLQDAANAVKLQSAKIALGDEIAPRVVKEIVDLLHEKDYVQELRKGGDHTFVGDADAMASTEYELSPRRLAEMGGLASVFEEEAFVLGSEEIADKRIGRYLLIREIGKGGMGNVYEALDEQSGRTVVVKMVSSGLGLIEEVKNRLKREARILGDLQHPNIVKYYDSGEDEGKFYIVMEYIDGIDLALLRRSQGKIALNIAVAIAWPVADALQYIHKKNYVRIDVKPGNILISKKGHVYLIDFGTAKPKTVEGESITQIGSFVGTPNYMSPEQFTGTPADERSDIYSFGVVLYEMLTGIKPLDHDSPEAARTRIYQTPIPPSKYVNLPSGIESIILKCLEPDPAKRFHTMSELINELDKFIGAMPSINLGPIAEIATEQVEKLDAIERMKTNPSLIEPLEFDRFDDTSDEDAEFYQESGLRFISGPMELRSQTYIINNRMTIGRSPTNDLVLDDPKVSRYNTEIGYESGVYYVEDLNSANSTLVNGVPIRAKTTLNHKDLIQIGGFVFEFRQAVLSRPANSDLQRELYSLPNQSKSRKAGSKSVTRKSDLLALISKVGVTLLASATLNETLRQVVALVFEAVPADRCLIMMRDEGSEELKVAVARLRDREGEVGEIRVSRSVIDEVIGKGRSVLTSDAQHDPRFAGSTMTIQNINSVLAVPLGVGEKVFGIIYADSPIVEGRFSEDHLKVLTTLASVAAIRVENARLLEEQMDRERLEHELQLASEIQQRFQPTAPPIVEGYELQGISFPCYEIGGDYYDFIEREDGRLVIALGDVSGKGTAAALLMSSLHTAVHAQASANHSLSETITAVNRYLAENIPSNRFVTLFYAELNTLTGMLSYVNAGHNPPVIVHAAGTVEHLAPGGLPLGIKADAVFREGRTQLQHGDVLVIYSDGVSEAVSPSDEEFGATRLYEVISHNMEASAAGIRDRIEAALTKWSQGTPASDDITLVIVKRQAESV